MALRRDWPSLRKDFRTACTFLLRRNNPDAGWHFAVTMGADEAGAERMLRETLLSHPAWATLTAVREGRFAVLDRDLFHFRPNERWAESYRIVFDLLYMN